MSKINEDLTYDDKIEQIKEDIELIKEYVIKKLSNDLNDETEQDFKKDFNLFIKRLENYFVDVFNDKSAEKKLLEEIPNIKPYWKLIKEIHKFDRVLCSAVSEDQQETENHVADILKAKSTLQFIKNNNIEPSEFSLPGEDKLYSENQANVKILRLSHFLAYVLSGKASDLVIKTKEKNPEISDSDLNKLIHKSFKENINYLNLNEKGVFWYDISEVSKSQPARNITDGVVFEEKQDGSIRCYMVFSTADNSTTKQRKQLFNYTDWFEKNKNDVEEFNGINLSKVNEVTPIFVCYPIISEDNKQNPFKNIFKSNKSFNSEEISLINSIPLLSQIGNVDNSDTKGSINKLLDTIYFAIGGGETLALQEQLKALKLIDSPEREKMFLNVLANKISSIAQLFSEKSNAEKGNFINSKNFSTNSLNTFQGITSMINGLINHCAYFKEDDIFLKEIHGRLEYAYGNFSSLTNKVNSKYNTDEFTWSAFKNSVKNIKPTSFIENVKEEPIAFNTNEFETDFPKDDVEKISKKMNLYINQEIEKEYEKIYLRGKRTDFSGHFNIILEHKLEHGENALFQTNDGLDIKTYQFLNKYVNKHGKNYDNRSAALNLSIEKLFNAIEQNHSPEDILKAIQVNEVKLKI